MTDEQQPEALRLADLLTDSHLPVHHKAAAELRRLHAETINQQDWFVEWKKCEQQVMGLSRLHAEQIGDIVALKEQRDELLGALTKLVGDLEMRSNWKRGSEKGVVDCGNSVYLKARAAIAKAGGAA